MKYARVYTDEEIELVSNTNLTADEIGSSLGVHPQTIYRLRKKLNIPVPIGAKPGKTNPARSRRETRQCIGKGCSNTFNVKLSATKKFCSHSCQQKTNNVAKKGTGSRTKRNPLIEEYTRYANAVHALSQKVYNEFKSTINPNDYPRTRCGVEGGWQLDHIIPVKECFNKGMTVEETSALSNLRMLPWRDNLMRQYGF